MSRRLKVDLSRTPKDLLPPPGAPALFGLSEVAPGTFEGSGVMFIPQIDALAMFYSVTGNALIEVLSGFPSESQPAPRGSGNVALEETNTGGARWTALTCEKFGRGVKTNATSTSPCRFRAPLLGMPSAAHGIRVRAWETPLFKPFEVRITFAGHQYDHVIRHVDEFCIQEMPG